AALRGARPRGQPLRPARLRGRAPARAALDGRRGRDLPRFLLEDLCPGLPGPVGRRPARGPGGARDRARVGEPVRRERLADRDLDLPRDARLARPGQAVPGALPRAARRDGLRAHRAPARCVVDRARRRFLHVGAHARGHRRPGDAPARGDRARRVRPRDGALRRRCGGRPHAPAPLPPAPRGAPAARAPPRGCRRGGARARREPRDLARGRGPRRRPSGTGPDMTTTSVLVLAGGLSHERDVSLRSGRRVAGALRGAGLEVAIHDVDDDLLPALAALRPASAWPLRHGPWGEDGSVRDILALVGQPYVGADPRASRVSWSKPIAKTVVSRAGVATPRFVTLPQSLFRELGAARVLESITGA